MLCVFIQIIDDSGNLWRVRNSLGETGYLPCSYLKEYKQSNFEVTNALNGRKVS